MSVNSQLSPSKRPSTFILSAMCFGFAFLYVPILVLVAYSFNGSGLATVWGGFSTRWYSTLLDNEQIINAAILSLKIAATSATVATTLAVAAGATEPASCAAPGRVLVQHVTRLATS